MLLRVSSEFQSTDVDMAAVNGEAGDDGNVEHGAKLVAFTEAVMRGDDAELAKTRDALRAVLTPQAFVDTCAVIGAFNVVDRIADATGIPLDAPMAALSAELRADLDLTRFRSSANTPGA
jgi:alkylhydroperoxidase family enzyme